MISAAIVLPVALVSRSVATTTAGARVSRSIGVALAETDSPSREPIVSARTRPAGLDDKSVPK